MSDPERKTINIPEICRVEGHAAVHVDIENGQAANVVLDVFEGTRFFEKIVVGHHFSEIPHITSRVCAICSTGHVIAAARSLEPILGFKPDTQTELFRELMHLGMVIESHATHIYALALPDFIGSADLFDFANNHADKFADWNRLRSLGSTMQTVIGGRPFHPVNLQIGGLSRRPEPDELLELQILFQEAKETAASTCELLLSFQPSFARVSEPVFLALIPEGRHYGYFGHVIQSSAGWQDTVQNYREYLDEQSVPDSHAKRSSARGQSLMVGALARLVLFHERLGSTARQFFDNSALSKGNTNSIWNNLAQAIEIVEAIERGQEIIAQLLKMNYRSLPYKLEPLAQRAGQFAGAVECPRGTLYHYYELDERGRVVKADMITPSAQNTARIELDIKEIVSSCVQEPNLQNHLETLVRAYDPCNTCATHMVKVNWK